MKNKLQKDSIITNNKIIQLSQHNKTMSESVKISDNHNKIIKEKMQELEKNNEKSLKASCSNIYRSIQKCIEYAENKEHTNMNTSNVVRIGEKFNSLTECNELEDIKKNLKKTINQIEFTNYAI